MCIPILVKRFLVVALVCSLLFTPTVSHLSGETRVPESTSQENSEAVFAWEIAAFILAVIVFGVSLIFMSGDNVEIGSVNAVLSNPADYHVGDERAISVDYDVSFGNISGSQVGTTTLRISGNGFTRTSHRSVTGASLVGGVPQQSYNNKLKLEATKEGAADFVHVFLKVTGEDYGFFWDSNASKTTSRSVPVTVLFPFTSPTVTNVPQGFEHPGPTPLPHVLTIGNFSTDPGSVLKAVVNGRLASNVPVPRGIDFATPLQTSLVDNAVDHKGPGHPGTSVAVPFNAEASGLTIFLDTRGNWFSGQFPAMAFNDQCDDPAGTTDTSTTPPPDTTGGPRRPSSGDSPTSPPSRSSDTAVTNDPVVSGILVHIYDPIEDSTYALFTDMNGNFSWTNLMLGPIVDLTINPGGVNPFFETKEMLNVPLDMLESEGPDGISKRISEKDAPPIIAEITTSGSDEVWCDLYSVITGKPDIFIGRHPLGSMNIDGLGALMFEGASSALRLIPFAGPNATLVSPATLTIPVDMTLPLVDLGAINLATLPHFGGASVEFIGNYISEGTGLPVSGVTIELYDTNTLALITSGSTNGSGDFSITVPSGPALAFLPNLSSFGLEPMVDSVEIDFGANGLATLDIGVKELRDPVAPPTCCQTPGDFNQDGSFNIADVTSGIARIFSGGPPPTCNDEGDTNGDGNFNIADVTFGIARIFSGGAAPVCGTTGT